MCINTRFIRSDFISDYQDITKYQFLVDKKLGEIVYFPVSLHV